MRQKVANYKGRDNRKEMGPSAPMPVGPMGEKHTRSAPVDDEALYGAYFSTPGYRPMMNVHSDDIEVSYNAVV